MNLEQITFTGADEGTRPSDLWFFESPIRVEWGILYSQSKQGEGRYPGLRWIDDLIESMPSNRRQDVALHVCGRAVSDLLAGVGHVSEVARVVDRIQINFRASSFSLESIRACISDHRKVITQHNHANEGLWRDLRTMPNHEVLFDASGGRGLSPDGWPQALPGVRCGYAGGLSPRNVKDRLLQIDLAAGGRPYWIDMEGLIRTQDDRFDLAACRQVVTEVEGIL